MTKRFGVLILVLLLFACYGQQQVNEAAAKAPAESSKKSISVKRKLAKFEPEDGEVLLFVGQELEAVGGLEEYNDGYLDHFDKPAGWTTYTNISPGGTSFGHIMQGLDGIYNTHDWGDNDYNVSLQLDDPDYKNMILAMGLSFVNHEEKVADGTHDVYINSLADFLLSLGERPVFLRIAYEFDGDPWNHYDRKSTIKAYKRIVDILKAKGVTNTAYVWQSAGFMSSLKQLEAWYPGDDYVDWLGTSFFNYWEKIQMFEFARKKGKPVFIAEATPTVTDFVNNPQGNSGLTKEMQLGNPVQAQMAWDQWFVPFFKTIDEHSDVVKAIHYINCHWDAHPMWKQNPTFKGIDARLHLSDSVSHRWKRITSQPKYVKSSLNLYDKLYHKTQ